MLSLAPAGAVVSPRSVVSPRWCCRQPLLALFRPRVHRVIRPLPCRVVRPLLCRVVRPCVCCVVSSGGSLCRVVPGGGRLDPLALINLGDMAPAPCVLWLSVSMGGLVRGTYLGTLLLIRCRRQQWWPVILDSGWWGLSSPHRQWWALVSGRGCLRWLAAAMVEDGWWWATVVGDGGGRQWSMMGGDGGG